MKCHPNSMDRQGLMPSIPFRFDVAAEQAAEKALPEFCHSSLRSE